MSYLRGAGAVGIRAGARDAAAVAVGGELYPLAGGGEERRTRGLKLCPPWVLAMLGLGKRWIGWRIYATPANQNTKKIMRMCN